MAQVELNEINNNIYIYIREININNVTKLFSRKIGHTMMMPHKLVWMDEKFM
jgi:hypothetical protein